MKLPVIFTVFSLFLSGCVASRHENSQSPPIPTQSSTPYTLSPTEISAVKQGVSSALKDPESARFGRFVAGKGENATIVTVCGFVNAKNSYGGYVGESPFSGTLLKNAQKNAVFIVSSIGGSITDSNSTKYLCLNYGIII